MSSELTTRSPLEMQASNSAATTSRPHEARIECANGEIVVADVGALIVLSPSFRAQLSKSWSEADAEHVALLKDVSARSINQVFMNICYVIKKARC